MREIVDLTDDIPGIASAPSLNSIHPSDQAYMVEVALQVCLCSDVFLFSDNPTVLQPYGPTALRPDCDVSDEFFF